MGLNLIVHFASIMKESLCGLHSGELEAVVCLPHMLGGGDADI